MTAKPVITEGPAWSATGTELAKAFSAVDKDGKGSIPASKLTDAIKESNPKVTTAEIERLVTLAEGSETISLKDFVMLMLFQQPIKAEVAA